MPDRILFTPTTFQVRAISPDVLTRDGSPHTGIWESPPLNPRGDSSLFTLDRLILLISSDDEVTLPVEFSFNGGRTWPVEREGQILESEEGIQRIAYFPSVTGFDLRFRIRFEPDSRLTIQDYITKLVRRSNV
jgi:hypothetical protein